MIQTQTSELALALEGWIILRNKKLVTTQLQLDSHNRNGAGDLNSNKNLHTKHKHCLENIGSELLVLIEVQTGSYFGEDDIVRT